jgi:hypothetical protein
MDSKYCTLREYTKRLKKTKRINIITNRILREAAVQNL